MGRRLARRNRIGLAIVGAILTLAGAAAFIRGLDLLPGLFGSADTAVTDPRTRELTSDHTWFWVVVAIALIVVALLALAWLISQARTGAVRTLRLEPDPRHGTTTASPRVATSALEADLTDSPYFRQAQATLLGSPGRPRLHLTTNLVPTTTDFTLARRRLQEALRRQRQALAADDTPTTVLIRAGR